MADVQRPEIAISESDGTRFHQTQSKLKKFTLKEIIIIIIILVGIIIRGKSIGLQCFYSLCFKVLFNSHEIVRNYFLLNASKGDA